MKSYDAWNTAVLTSTVNQRRIPLPNMATDSCVVLSNIFSRYMQHHSAGWATLIVEVFSGDSALAAVHQLSPRRSNVLGIHEYSSITGSDLNNFRTITLLTGENSFVSEELLVD